MKVHAAYYAMLKDETGTASEAYDLPDGTTVSGLMAAIAARHPKFAAREKHLAIVSGDAYVDRSYRLKEGEEISFIPPVSGGSGASGGSSTGDCGGIR